MLSHMNEVDSYVASAMGFCMRCITSFSNNWYPNKLQYHACITCD